MYVLNRQIQNLHLFIQNQIMKYTVDKKETHTVFSINESNLNTLIAPDLKSELYILHDAGIKDLILDISDVQYVDSSGLSAILTGHRIWKTVGSFVLTGVKSESVKKLIEISRLESVLNIVPTLDESVDYIKMEQLERDMEAES